MGIVIGDGTVNISDSSGVREEFSLSEKGQAALKLAEKSPPFGGSFRINGEHRHYTVDCVHQALFGFSLRTAVRDNRLQRNLHASPVEDPDTAQRVFDLFKYNVLATPLSTAIDGTKFAELSMTIPRSIVDLLGTSKARSALQNEMIALLEPFRGAAAFWRIAPQVENKSSAGIGIYARVHLMLAHEYEMLLPMDMRAGK